MQNRGFDFLKRTRTDRNHTTFDHASGGNHHSASASSPIALVHLNKTTVDDVFSDQANGATGPTTSVIPLITVDPSESSLGGKDHAIRDGQVSIRLNRKSSSAGTGTLKVSSTRTTAARKKLSDLIISVVVTRSDTPVSRGRRPPGTKPILSLGTSSTPWIENRTTPITIFGGCVPAIQNHIGSDRDVASGNRSDNQGLIASQRDGTGAGN